MRSLNVSRPAVSYDSGQSMPATLAQSAAPPWGHMGCIAMERVNMLREQAKLLHDLAAITTDGRGIRERMLALARDCEELAAEREQYLASAGKVPS